MVIVCCKYLLVGGELGTDTKIGLLVGSSSYVFTPIFAFMIFVLKTWCF